MYVYAKQISPEYQESPLFYNDECFPGNIAVCGNRNFHDHLPEVFQNVREVLTSGNLAEMLENPKELGGWYKNMTEAITDYLPPEKGRYGTRAIHSLKELVLQFSTCPSREENTLLCKVLSIVAGQKWGWGTIRGSVQSDWQEIFYPVDEWSMEAICAFEREYFNTGSEWIIHDGETEPTCPEEISGYGVYCISWNEDEIRKELADASGVAPENIKMFALDSTTTTEKYIEVI